MRIIPRADWGARYDNGAGAAPLPAAEVWLHHSVTAAVNGFGIIRDIEAVGESRFGTGISYTWLVTPDGSVYEGHSPDRLGTHTGGRNSIARAICWVGNYEDGLPTAAQVRSTAWLLQETHRRGWIRSPRLNGGHRDLKATACPGKHAYALIAEINRLAAGPPITEETDVELTDPMRAFIWPHTADINDTVGSTLANTQSYTKTILDRMDRMDARLAAIEARPVADIDEVALAAELDKRGIGGVSATELIQILANTRLVPTQEGNPS